MSPPAEADNPATPNLPEPGADDTETVPEATPDAGGRSLLRSNGIVAAGTLLSRLTGVVRLVALLVAVDESLQDTYLLANNTPNIVYELILGGILTATLVPLFTEHDQHTDDGATTAVVSVVLSALGVLTVAAMLISPLLILLYSLNPGPDVDVDQLRSVGVTLALLFAPQVFFYGCMAVGSALLNARRRFFAAAWAPVLNNLIVSAVLFGVALTLDSPDLDRAAADKGLRLVLGLGTTAGIAAMAVSLLPALHRAGYRFGLQRPSLRHPAVRKVARLSGWTLGYVVANQIAAQAVNVLAEPGSGQVASYQVAFMFFQLPHGLLAVSLMTTIQPDLARASVRTDWADFHRRLLVGLRLLLVVIVPAAIGYLVLSVLLVRIRPDLPFVGGARDRDSVFEKIAALGGFAPGLIGFSVYLFVLRAFYAIQDTRRPFLINCGENALNIAAAVVLVIPFGVVGLTSAYSVAYLVFAVVALVVLLGRLPAGFDRRGLLDTVARCLAAAAVMAVVVAAIVLLAEAMDGDYVGPALTLGIVVGVGAYAGTAAGLGLHRTTGIGSVLARRRGR